MKFFLVPSSDLRRKKGHQIVASMGQNAGKIKASNVEIKMQMPLQRDLRRLVGDKKIETPSGKRGVIKLTKWFKTLDHQGFPAPSPAKLSEDCMESSH